MLEVIIPGIRYGQAKINSSSAYRGQFCYIAGVDASGYQLLQVPYSSVTAAKAYFPVDKKYFAEDLSDTAAGTPELLTKSDTIIYYDGGEYVIDKFKPSSFGLTNAYWHSVDDNLSTGTTVGRKLYKPGSSTAISVVAGTWPRKCYVSTGLGSKFVLYGDTSFSRGAAQWVKDRYVGYAIEAYYSSSADCKIRVKVARNLYSGPTDTVA